VPDGSITTSDSPHFISKLGAMSAWDDISQVGVDANGNWLKNRDILLCNRVSIILSGLTLFMFMISLASFGWIMPVRLALAASIFFLLPLLLNSRGLVNTSRLFLAVSLNVVAVIISVFDKMDIPYILEEFQYFHFRLMLLGAGLFPFILFQLSEKKFWITACAINVLCILLFDPIHELFGVGYYQLGFHGPNYYFINYMVVTISLILGGSTFFLKYSFEIFERKNELLIHNLNKANGVIQSQQELLTKENIQLSRDLVDKNNQLTETNQELIQHNNELLQFSYSVSHNLRGPVASMLGLLNLINTNDLQGESKEITAHIRNSVVSLDSTIRDLGSIIDIRNKVTKIKQPVSLEEELTHVITLLKKEIEDQDVQVIQDLGLIKTLYSVKPMINSILYNLISNAIKYRSLERRSIIVVRALAINDHIRIEVTDNGLGLDVEKYREKLFGLYKRFHNHTEGKGIGLFLVKLQTEALGGHVDVQSVLGEGTTFSITLKTEVPLEETTIDTTASI
jgi:signal transduction histidine kinase